MKVISIKIYYCDVSSCDVLFMLLHMHISIHKPMLTINKNSRDPWDRGKKCQILLFYNNAYLISGDIYFTSRQQWWSQSQLQIEETVDRIPIVARLLADNIW